MPGARIGVIGVGTMGAAHVRTLARRVPDADVVAVSDVSADRARSAAAEAPGIRAHADPHELIAREDLDGVLIAASDETHEALVLACLEAGRPVLCEKPLAATAAGALRLVEAERAAGGGLVQVGFMRRYDRGYLRLRERIAGGTLGAPRRIHCAHRNAGDPPGVPVDTLLTSSLPHEIDAARWLTGQEIAEVTVSTGPRDPLRVVLRTAGDVLVDVELLASGDAYDIRCEVVAEAGTAAIPVQPAPGFRERFAEAYRDELRGWVRGILAGALTGPTAWDGYAANAVADAALASLADGRPAPVRLHG